MSSVISDRPICSKCGECINFSTRNDYHKCPTCGEVFITKTQKSYISTSVDMRKQLRLPDEGSVRLRLFYVPHCDDHDGRPDREYYSRNISIKKCVYRKDYPKNDDPNVGKEVVVYKLPEAYSYTVVVRHRSYHEHWDDITKVSGKKKAIETALGVGE